ncbi:MAG: polysaccharide biosynthesis/export family protein [Candidatus Omnitrophota bacterium]
MFFRKITMLVIIIISAFCSCTNVFALDDKEQEDEIGIRVDNEYNASEVYILEDYILGIGDVLDIQVQRHSELSGRFRVRHDGTIQYVFVGDIKVGDLTTKQIKEKLLEELTKFVKQPEVILSIAEFNSKKIYVIGAVARPGEYPMRGNILTVREAVLAAGLTTHLASMRKTRIITPAPNEKKVKVKKINLLALLYEGDLSQNIQLESGDIVYVPFTMFGKLGVVLDQIVNPFYKAAVIESIGKR